MSQEELAQSHCRNTFRGERSKKPFYTSEGHLFPFSQIKPYLYRLICTGHGPFFFPSLLTTGEVLFVM